MAHYADLEPCWYFGPLPAAHLRAVGWLESGMPFTRGKTDPALRDRLSEFCSNKRAHGPMFMGGHSCTLCSTEADVERKSFSNICIPSGDVVFVSPEGILHYIDRHEYLPPQAYAAAVMACPEPGSGAYSRAMAHVCWDTHALSSPPRFCPFCRKQLAAIRATYCHMCGVVWKVPGELDEKRRRTWVAFEASFVRKQLRPLQAFVCRLPGHAMLIRRFVDEITPQVERVLSPPALSLLPVQEQRELTAVWRALTGGAVSNEE